MYSMAIYSAKKQDLITEEKNMYWVKISSLSLMWLDHRMWEGENKVREIEKRSWVSFAVSIK